MLDYICFFFFKQKTAYEMRISDWSSDVCSSDLLTFFSAVHASLSALLAVFHLMFLAFLSACTADLGAKGTKFFSELTFATHQGGGQPTNVRAVAVKLEDRKSTRLNSSH